MYLSNCCTGVELETPSRKAAKGCAAIHALVTFVRMFFKEKLEAIWVLVKGFAGG
jgi:hypothetical protein